MPMILPNEATVLHAYAVLVGETPGNAAFTVHQDYITTNGVAGYKSALNSIFANYTNAQLGNLLLTNLGLTSIFTAAEAEAYIAANASNRVGAMIDLAAALYNYTGDVAAITTAKTAYVNTIAGSYNYSIDPDNTAGTTLSGAIISGGQTFTLTTGVDSFTGGTGNDTFNGSDTTLAALDSLTGGTGTDTLNVIDTAGTNFTGKGFTLSGIEAVSIRSATGTVQFDGSTFADVTSLSVTQAVNATLTAGSSSTVSVAGATGDVVVDGGTDVTVTSGTAGKATTIGATTVASGNITVTDTNVGAADIKVDGGKNVSITATGSTGGANVITVGNGGATTDLPSGTVAVTSAHTGVAGTDVALSAITVKGGSTVTVTQTADTSKAATDTTGATLTQGAVTVVGGATTAVTVTQAASKGETVAVTAVAGVTETASVKFGALKANDILIIGGDGDATLEAGELQFTASKDMTAAQVAAAFANLVNGTVPVAGDTQGGGAASNGTYTGSLTGWTSGAVSTDTVVFTSTTANSNVTDLAQNLAGTGTAPTVTTTAGSAATAAVTGVLGVITGAVTIDDAATAAITSVALNGYGTTSIGNTATLSKLQTLSLANSGGATAGATNAAATVDAAGVATLGLTVNNVKGAVSLDGAADSALKTLNVTATGANSDFGLTAASVETLTVAGDKVLDIDTGSTLTALKTVTVTGSAGLNIVASGANVTSVNSSGTTGAVTATIDGSKASYTGGAGVDDVSMTAQTISKTFSLGAGDDKLTLTGATLSGAFTASGGDGTDTLVMGATQAETVSASAVFEGKVDGFERLGLGATTAAAAIDLSNLDDISYVSSAGTGGGFGLTLNKMASGGTFALTGNNAAGVTISLTDATGTSDSLNVILTSTAALTGGTVTAAGVETVAITSDDTDTTAHTNTLTLTAADATAVTVGGDAALTLTMTGSTKVTSINGSAMTKALSVTSLNTTSATTITGGSDNDVLTAATGSSTADVLIGGAGDDTLTANAGLNTLTGGAGNDVFVIGTASANVNSYATITDFAAGDLLKLTGIDSFASAAVTLGDTAVFQDYANAAINALGANDAGWFQFGGNTYVVADIGNTTAFVNGTDFIVKLTGLVNLTNASFNDTQDTIAL